MGVAWVSAKAPNLGHPPIPRPTSPVAWVSAEAPDPATQRSPDPRQVHGLIMGLVVVAEEANEGSGASGPEGDRAIEQAVLLLGEGGLAGKVQCRAPRA
ncbi:MAG: hypothetical protein ACOYM4_01360 [Nodosilinea sp.]